MSQAESLDEFTDQNIIHDEYFEEEYDYDNV